MIELIKDEFRSNANQLANLETELEKSPNPYQSAFSFLSGRRDQNIANRIIAQAVLKARKTSDGIDQMLKSLSSRDKMSTNLAAAFDSDINNWNLTEGVEAIGQLATVAPDTFGKLILTSNFDPLIEVAIESAGGKFYKTTLDRDGDINQTVAAGCHIIHLHGYWNRTDTLHTPRQLGQQRPNLKTSLASYLRDKTLLVAAYGGWMDIFTQTLEAIFRETDSLPDVLWTFLDSDPVISDELWELLSPGANRGRVTFYKGINCHSFFPQLRDQWSTLDAFDETTAKSVVIIRSKTSLTHLLDLDCDRPPTVDAWVGRHDQLSTLNNSDSRVIVLDGIGGEGKSALAAQYLRHATNKDGRFQYWDWRDCRESGDIVRTKLLLAIERLTLGRLRAIELIEENNTTIVDLFIKYATERPSLYIFDNVDHYVDLELGTFTGILNDLVRKASSSFRGSRLVVTCRPKIQHAYSSTTIVHLTGLTLDDAIKLFELRGATDISPQLISDAHELTKGHAFWLDIIAAQVGGSGHDLSTLLKDYRRGRNESPDILSPVWNTLASREQTILRAMAETVRPETADRIAEYVSHELNYNQFNRGLNSLRRRNLVVTKPQEHSADHLELHPIVRQYVRTRFGRQERATYINPIIKVYGAMVTAYRDFLNSMAPLSVLETWSQKAELEIEAGSFAQAFATLAEADTAFVGGGYSEEYVRVSTKLFETIDWMQCATTIPEFDGVFRLLIHEVAHLGDITRVDGLLAKFEHTIPEKNARYIDYCNMRCYCFWFRGEHQSAIEWGERGVDLKRSSDVDTQFDCEHNLALARRDSGNIDQALAHFLLSKTLEDVLDESKFDSQMQGAYYGNIGRCLQLRKQPLEALICYKMSARLLEADDGETRLINQGYVRLWIGETLLHLGEANDSYLFFRSSLEIWEKVSPQKAGEVHKVLDSFDEAICAKYSRWSQQKIDNHVRNWIRGKISTPITESRDVEGRMLV